MIVGLGSETVQQLREIVYLRKGLRAQRWQQQRLHVQHAEYVDRTVDFQVRLRCVGLGLGLGADRGDWFLMSTRP
jgi:hypothetical protein